jgi:hypothetical protein
MGFGCKAEAHFYFPLTTTRNDSNPARLLVRIAGSSLGEHNPLFP